MSVEAKLRLLRGRLRPGVEAAPWVVDTIDEILADTTTPHDDELTSGDEVFTPHPASLAHDGFMEGEPEDGR